MRAIYGDSVPSAPGPALDDGEKWKRDDAIKELVRGRIEVCGPITTASLAHTLNLPPFAIGAALLALEAEGFVLRGSFNQGATEVEWCDRRLLARIHRLTINRLRAEIQAVSLADFQRFLLAWQRGGADHRAEGPDGVRAVLELLDGYELPAAAWEPEVLALRVNNYTPAWLDQLCFTGRIGWSRLTPPQTANGRLATPVRSTPISIYARENLPHWLALSAASLSTEFSPDATRVQEVLDDAGALFFGEIVKRTGLLPSRVEKAIAELAASGWVTSDSFEGLRALLVPDEKKEPFAPSRQRRHHRAVTSIEFAGRWSVASRPDPEAQQQPRRVARRSMRARSSGATGSSSGGCLKGNRSAYHGSSFSESIGGWKLEARFAAATFVAASAASNSRLPEAIGLLRSVRRKRPRDGRNFRPN